MFEPFATDALRRKVLSSVHQLRNHLMVIMNSAELLDGGLCDPQADQDIEAIKKAAKACDATLEALHAEARGEWRPRNR